MLNLRPVLCFELAPNMQIACIELCIYIISKSVYDRTGRYKKKRMLFGAETIPRTSLEILYTFGRQPTVYSLKPLSYAQMVEK